MNKKVLPLLVLTTALLLSGCGKKKKDPYVYPDDDTDVVFDYSFNDALKNELDLMYFVDGANLSISELNQFLATVVKNDYYANQVLYEYSKQKLFLAENDVDKVDGDYNYQERRNITRDNEKNSLSGTIYYHDEAWDNSETEPVELIHKNIETNGSYSLVPNPETELGVETINCDNDNYDFVNDKIGFSQQKWLNRMNLTQTHITAEKFGEFLSEVEEQNNMLPVGEQFVTNIISRKAENAIQVEMASVSYRKNIQYKYYVSIKVAGGIVKETDWRYSEIEMAGEEEFVLVSEEEKRTISHI